MQIACKFVSALLRFNGSRSRKLPGRYIPRNYGLEYLEWGKMPRLFLRFLSFSPRWVEATSIQFVHNGAEKENDLVDFI